MSILAVGPIKLAADEVGTTGEDGVAVADCCIPAVATVDPAGRLGADGANVAVAVAPTGSRTSVVRGMVVGAAGGAAHEANTAMAMPGTRSQYPRRSNVTSPVWSSVRGPVLQKFRRKFWDFPIGWIIGHKVIEDRVHVCLADGSTIDVIHVKKVCPLVFGFVCEGDRRDVVTVDTILQH